MKHFHLKGHAEPERLSVSLRDMEVLARREDGQFEFTAIAQFFDIVNDRLMVFRHGSFAKTIAENVMSGSGRVKINDGHSHSSASTLGTVIEAEERSEGVWYRGLISSTEESIFTKMREGHVDENSIEFFSIREGTTRVALEEVPTGTPLWDRAKGDDTVEAREMLEVAWVGIAVLPFSSQGRRALLETNSAVPFQDLPVASASTSWDPKGAAERLAAWAGKVSMPSRPDTPNYARLSRGFLLRGPVKDGAPQLLGQIADVIDGKLVVVPDAIDAALEQIGNVEHVTGPDVVACAQNAGRYTQKLRHSGGIAVAPSSDDALPSDENDAADPAGPASENLGTQPPTDDDRSDDAPVDVDEELLDRDLRLLSLRFQSLAARFPEVQDDSTGTGRDLPQRGPAAIQ